LWPGGSPAAATSLKVAVHALRQILGTSPGAVGGAVEIDFVDVGYLLRADHLWLDVDEFAKLCRQGAAAVRTGDDAGACACYRSAMDLYRGDYLAQESAEWIEEHRQWYRAQALQALEVLRTEAIARGDLTVAADWCRRTVEIDPYHERSYQVLMSLHGRRGERGLVRSWYELCLQRLHDLAVDPAPATQVVYDRAMRGPRVAPA
jgi:DNA-binding SARP family transcriptional activator